MTLLRSSEPTLDDKTKSPRRPWYTATYMVLVRELSIEDAASSRRIASILQHAYQRRPIRIGAAVGAWLSGVEQVEMPHPDGSHWRCWRRQIMREEPRGYSRWVSMHINLDS
jgi:hypothetical protein